jgi:hypothetical protein
MKQLMSERLVSRIGNPAVGESSRLVNQNRTAKSSLIADAIDIVGQPYFVSEFGGIKWNPAETDSKESWGYGNTPKSLDEFYDRFDKLCAVLLDNKGMFAYCYTQLTDVFQEQNGIYNFDRSEKFDMARIKAAQQKKAAIEG